MAGLLSPRRRTTMACTKCRARKKACYGGRPCNLCKRMGQECIFMSVEEQKYCNETSSEGSSSARQTPTAAPPSSASSLQDFVLAPSIPPAMACIDPNELASLYSYPAYYGSSDANQTALQAQRISHTHFSNRANTCPEEYLDYSAGLQYHVPYLDSNANTPTNIITRSQSLPQMPAQRSATYSGRSYPDSFYPSAPKRKSRIRSYPNFVSPILPSVDMPSNVSTWNSNWTTSTTAENHDASQNIMMGATNEDVGDYFYGISSFPTSRITGIPNVPYSGSPEPLSGFSSNVVYNPISPVYQEIMAGYTTGL